MTNTAKQPGCEVLVELSDCAESDAQTVFEALRESYSGDRPAEDVPHQVVPHRPSVWSATFDVCGERKAGPPHRLGAPVDADLQGGYHAVDELRSALTSAFTVEVVGTVSGDQENQLQLRLESR
ncbi:hypothetical protein [Streptomyces sp. NPDC058045]|uniref:hypothetical protein n=1 Tax=Streptomyces sp. NPDC058045 TaxID=3346311 RepID=UPI0036E14720